MNEIKLKAMAKINLALDVVRRREDGYHEVRMIMQTVNLFDELTFIKVRDSGIRISANLDDIPVNEDNLIYKAAKLLMDEFDVSEGIEISLVKRIPVAAGMAGGSTDAASTLVAVNELFELGLSRRQLMERAVKIGADVPYCIMGGTVLSEGIGEVLTPIAPAPKCRLLIAKPPISVSTKFVYQNLKLDESIKHPDIDRMIEAVNGGDIKEVSQLLGNILESVTTVHYPVIEEIKDFMKDHGALGALMSGSGPTVFGVFDDEISAKSCYEELKKKTLAKDVFLTDFYMPEG